LPINKQRELRQAQARAGTVLPPRGTSHTGTIACATFSKVTIKETPFWECGNSLEQKIAKTAKNVFTHNTHFRPSRPLRPSVKNPTFESRLLYWVRAGLPNAYSLTSFSLAKPISGR
jgi:hypothetical protein